MKINFFILFTLSLVLSACISSSNTFSLITIVAKEKNPTGSDSDELATKDLESDSMAHSGLNENDIGSPEALADTGSSAERSVPDNHDEVLDASFRPNQYQLQCATIDECSDLGLSIATRTGFFVSKKGYLVTDYEAVSGALEVVVLFDGHSFPAEIIDLSETDGLALLRIDYETPALSVQMDPPQKGQSVGALGFTSEIRLSDSAVTKYGDISELFDTQSRQEFLQFSAEIQPISAGSPLIDEQGHIVGVLTTLSGEELASSSTVEDSIDINYALKSDYLITFLGLVPDIILADYKDPHLQILDAIKKVRPGVVRVLKIAQLENDTGNDMSEGDGQKEETREALDTAEKTEPTPLLSGENAITDESIESGEGESLEDSSELTGYEAEPSLRAGSTSIKDTTIINSTDTFILNNAAGARSDGEKRSGTKPKYLYLERGSE